MKKSILLALFFLLYVTSFAWIKTSKHKSNGGWFGYSNITEAFLKDGNNCTFSLVCSDPGWNWCRFTTYDVGNATSTYGCQAITTNIEENWWDVLDENINEQIASGYTSGILIRQDIQVSHPVTYNMENAVVTWVYSVANDIVEMTIYSYNEADALGII